MSEENFLESERERSRSGGDCPSPVTRLQRRRSLHPDLDSTDDRLNFSKDETSFEKEEDESDNDQTDSDVVTDADDRSSSTVRDLYKKEQGPERPGVNHFSLYLIIPSLLIACVIYFVQGNEGQVKDTQNFDLIKSEFPQQHQDLWLSFETGVKDVTAFNKPSTFIFLYEAKSEPTLKKLLKKLSKFAVCNITDCGNTPIVLTREELNTPRILQDQGNFINQYKNSLKQSGVMIVHNLDDIRGIAAQAFHFFCDEFTPLIEKSLFIFTMKVDQLPGEKKMRFVENRLRERWNEIKPDILGALITRITNIVIEIF